MPRFMSTEDGTPCPVRSSASGSSSSRQHYSGVPPLSFPAFDDDETDNLDFTRAVPPEAQMYKSAVAPRRKALKEPPRRVTAHVPTNNKPEHQEQQIRKEHEIDTFVNSVVSALEPERRHQGLQQQPRRSMLKPAVGKGSRRRVSAILKERVKRSVPSSTTEIPETHETYAQTGNETATRTVRRSQDHNEKRKEVLSEKSRNLTVSPKVSRQLQQVKGEKRHLQAPPKRIPLQSTTVPQQQNIGIDMHKEMASGKENVPPGRNKDRNLVERRLEKVRDKNSVPNDSARLPKRAITAKKNVLKPVVHRASPEQPHVTESRKRSSDGVFNDDEASFCSERSNYSEYCSKRSSADSLRLIKRQRISIESLLSPPSLTQEEEYGLLCPERDVLLPQLPRKSRNRSSGDRRLDPLLNEDLVRCEMYEDNWLSAQEASVSQLLNHLLTQYSPTPTSKDRIFLRKEFIAMYSSPPFPLVYNRVHASLLYGALSITQSFLEKGSTAKLVRNVSAHNCGWGADIGMRERFLDLFLGSYDRTALITGLEVVVGREMFALTAEDETEKHVAENFLNRYLVRSEDILSASSAPETHKKARSAVYSSEDEDRGSPAWMLRRSLLRSFMLILLLDKAKAQGLLGRQCLFQKRSLHKSSKSVLTGLAKLLLPSMGDVFKPLSHLNYSLEVLQQPLSEYDYEIRNIAVDMRDGVKLVRLMEVLLYSEHGSSPLKVDSASDIDDNWPLSPHLHYPAASRAQRIHNVSLALSSLRSASGDVQLVEAKDIVDGFREKTVGFLWSIVSHWGLQMLLDWEVIKHEIQRLNKRPAGVVEKASGRLDYTGLLKAWAREIARKHGLTVENLTTSFADGAVFEAIVDEYEQYLPSLVKRAGCRSLEVKLQGIGCNSYFSGLFSLEAKRGRVFNQDFVVSALAYLASRLLQPSITERAAIIIQRSYRKYMFRETVHKRINLLLLAHDCAQVAETRNRVVKATIAIQRVFRVYLKRKIDTLVSCMTTVQCQIRGQLARRQFEYKVCAVVLLQRQWRKIREAQFHRRVGFAKQSMIGLQSRIRGTILRSRIITLKESIYKISEFWRTSVLAKQERLRFLGIKNATLLLQNVYRRVAATRQDRAFFSEARQHIKGLQALLRGSVCRRSFAIKLTASVAIQRWWTSSKEVRRLRDIFLQKRQAVLYLQRRRRETILARFARGDFLLLKISVEAMKQRYQEKKRLELAALILQRAWRKQAWLLRMRRILQGAVQEALHIQNVWRGYCVRKEASPRFRIIRKRLDRLVNKGTNKDERLGNRMRKGLEMVKTKTGFGRGILQIELATRYSRECAKAIAEDTALSTVLDFLDTSVSQMQKASTSITSRNLVLATNVIANLARCHLSCEVLASRIVTKDNSAKDTFAILLRQIDSLKMAPSNTPQGEILLSLMKTLGQFASNEKVRKRLLVRKKWVENLQRVLKDLKAGTGKKRGAGDDDLKIKAAQKLCSVFEFYRLA